MDYPQHMVWLPPDHVASKVVFEGEPVLFEHFFHDKDEYYQKIRGDLSGMADNKFDTISTYSSRTVNETVPLNETLSPGAFLRAKLVSEFTYKS